MTRLRERLRSEEGWVLATAMIILAAMLSLGLATFSWVDGQQRQSLAERQKDSAFNLAEAAMNMTVFSLTNNWPGPGTSSNPWPTCTQTSTDSRCPGASTLAGVFPGPDATGATWQVNVYDNGINGQGQSSASWYSDNITPAQPSFDVNGDMKLWVRSQATVNGNTRVLVEQVQLLQLPASLPHDVVIAGSLQTGNNGNKVLIDTQGSALQASGVEVRCNRSTDPNCLQYRAGQISPDTSMDQYTGGNAMSAATLTAIKEEAQANGTYYATCPSSMPDSFSVLWIDSGDCSYVGTNTINSSSSPGLTIINNGTFQLGGSVTYYGVIYALNAQGATSESAPVVETFGNAHVVGGILIDGGGNLEVASSHTNLTFDDNAFSSIKAFGNVIPIQNTFRQIPHS